jgi:hypothetical protein
MEFCVVTDNLEDPKKNVPAVSFDDFDIVENEAVEDTDDKQSDRVIQGTRLVFTNDFVWETSDEEEFPGNRELVVVETLRILQKWIEHRVTETVHVAADQKWPNVDKLNDQCPRSEWQEQGQNGQPQGPWQRTRVVYLVDLETMEKFTFASGTIGADIGVHELRDRIRMRRRFSGATVYPVITLGDTFMSTRWGGRQRPDFKIVRWVQFGHDNKALPAPAPTALPPASTKEALDKFADDKKPEPEFKPEPEIKSEARKPQTNPAAKTATPNKQGVVKTGGKAGAKLSANPSFEEILGDELDLK